MVHHSVCPLCSSENMAPELKCTDFFVTREQFDIYHCNSCGFRFTQDVPEEDQMGRYYESDEYISHSDTSRGLVNKLYRLVRDIMLRRKRNIVTRYTGLSRGALLDIGSGTGHFASTMKKAGWDVKTVEINDRAREYSSSVFGLDSYSPPAMNSMETGSFDCITLWHVLEHFHNPSEYLGEINRLLKSGGLCVIALPNSGSYDASWYQQFWAAYDVPRHLWHFNSSTISMFMAKSGFTIKEIRQLPADVFYISMLSEKYSGSKVPMISGMLKALGFSLLTFFNPEKGSSLIYLLKKKADQ